MRKVLIIPLLLVTTMVSVTPGQSPKYRSAKGLFHLGYVEPANQAPAQPAKPKLKPAPQVKTQPILVTNLSQASENMGIRYRITQLVEPCEQVPVDANSLFRAGDQIRFSMESNTDGYLYILNQGTSGAWRYIFPHPLINGGENLINKGVEYTIPPRSWLKFDQNPGEEVIIVVVTKNKLDPLESGILEQRQSNSSIPPTSQVIQELNNHLKTRDLIFEQEYSPISYQGVQKKVVQNTYVVNPDPDSYFVTRIVLKHNP